MEIPWQRLQDETLTALIEEFVSREGTEYGEREYSLAEKVAQVRRQLREGRARILYDAEADSCHIESAEKDAR